jgi:hypothetical protein
VHRARPLVAQVIVVLVGVALIWTGWPALAAQTPVKRTDPREDAFIDVRSTSKVTLMNRRVRFRVRFTGPDWKLNVLVDPRGGQRAEYKLSNVVALGPMTCGGRRLFDGEIELRCGLRMLDVGAQVAWWSIPRAELRPDKRIRWRVHTFYPGAKDHDDDDFAPDSGWYP